MTGKNGKRLINFAVFLNFVKVYNKLEGIYFPSLGLRIDIPLWNYLCCRIHSWKYMTSNSKFIDVIDTSYNIDRKYA